MLLPPWIHMVITFQGTRLFSLFCPKYCLTLSNQRGRLRLNCSTSSLPGKKLGYFPSMTRTVLSCNSALSLNSCISSASVSAQLLKPWKRWFLGYPHTSDSLSPEAVKIHACSQSLHHHLGQLCYFSQS